MHGDAKCYSLHGTGKHSGWWHQDLSYVWINPHTAEVMFLGCKPVFNRFNEMENKKNKTHKKQNKQTNTETKFVLPLEKSLAESSLNN